jgi:hypothetical protein
MKEKTTPAESASRLCYETMEAHARSCIQRWLQELLEAEVIEFLGRAKSQRPAKNQVVYCVPLQAAPLHRSLGRNLLVREFRYARALGRMFNRDSANIAHGIHIQDRVLVQIASFRHCPLTELNVQGVGVGEVLDLHGSNLRSKKALWTVSPSGRT